jgi:acyl-CoA synthetase (AMP-forming)/AMP-acid ligase II/acyl carrier protein
MKNILDRIDEWVEKAPQKPAFIFVPDPDQEGQVLSFSALKDRAQHLASILLETHQAQSRVLILLPQSLDYVVAILGCFYAGMVAVPGFMPRKSRNMERHEAIIEDCGAELIIGGADLKKEVQKSDQTNLKSCTWLTPDAGQAGTVKPQGIDHPALTDLAFLQYTSGSTGQPKGVVVTHGNLAANASLSKKEFGFLYDDVMGSWLPFYHDMGLVGHVLQSAYNGMTSVFMPPASFVKRPLNWLNMLSRYKVNITGAPNFALELCADRIKPEEAKALDLTSLRIFYSGAEKVQKTTLERFAKHFSGSGFEPSSFQPCYGLAEATLMVSTRKTAPDAAPVERLVPVSLNPGQAVPESPQGPTLTLLGNGKVPEGSEVEIVHPDTLQVLPECQVGEVWIKAKSIAQGYWNQAELSAHTFQARTAGGKTGFLRTGDLGFLEKNELFIIGRLKEVLIIRGQNYDPVDLEKAACGTDKPLNRDAAVAFTMEGIGTEKLALALEVKRSFWRKLDHEQLAAAVRARLAESFDLKVSILLLVKPHAIPKTTSGKIQRYKCKEQFEAGKLPLLYKWEAPIEDMGSSLPTIEATNGTDDPATKLRLFLTAEVGRRLSMPAEQIKGDVPLTDYGLDSMNAMELVGEIEAKFNINLDPTLLWEVPTINELVEFCETHYFEKGETY